MEGALSKQTLTIIPTQQGGQNEVGTKVLNINYIQIIFSTLQRPFGRDGQRRVS